MDTTLIVECQGDVRRALLKGNPSFVTVDQAVQEMWLDRRADEAKYEDEEGDMCSLRALTFSDFLSTAKATLNGQTLELHLDISKPTANVKQQCYALEAFASAWLHVELGSDAQCLHTVADLTDVPQSEGYVVLSLSEEKHTSDLNCLPEDVAELSNMADHWSADCWVRMRKLGELEAKHVAAARDADQSNTAQESPTECGAVWSMQLQQLGKPGNAVAQQDSGTTGPHLDHGAGEKVEIIIAAFDENGDAHLGFGESNTLHKAAWGGLIPWQTFQQLCAAFGEDPEVGLGSKSLMCLYGDCALGARALHKDFETAMRKLQEGTLEEHPVAVAGLNPAWWHYAQSLATSGAARSHVRSHVYYQLTRARGVFAGLRDKFASWVIC